MSSPAVPHGGNVVTAEETAAMSDSADSAARSGRVLPFSSHFEHRTGRIRVIRGQF